MIINEYKHSDITSEIIGCAMTVRKILGSGFMEVVYQRASAIGMKLQHIDFQENRKFRSATKATKSAQGVRIFLSKARLWSKPKQ